MADKSKSWFFQRAGTWIVAEIGINHNGSEETAIQLVNAALLAGADAVKFQVRDLAEVYTRKVLDDSLTAEQGTQYLLHELRKAEIEKEGLRRLVQYAQSKFPSVLATPFDCASVAFLEELGIPVYKVGSPDFTNLPLIDRIHQTRKPILLSTGMSSEQEIRAVIHHLEAEGADFALLHCQSTYPAGIGDIQLTFMDRLREWSGVPVGYSGHERGFAPTLAAVARGAKIIERHITLDSRAEGPDHSSSLEPDEFRAMVQAIREIEACLGSGPRRSGQGEQINRVALGKSLVTTRKIRQGETLQTQDLSAKSPARGVSPLQLHEFLGKKVLRDLEAEEYILPKDVGQEGKIEIPRGNYRINKNWGIVGRLNDFQEYLSWKPKLIEIHLTWRDLVNFDPKKLGLALAGYDQDLVVHAPEYYQDALIDFTDPDAKVRDYSVEMLRLTCQLARSLAGKFRGIRGPRGPRVVVHPGGHFTRSQSSDRKTQYSVLAANLREVDTEGVELLVENMPPFPWYFGGQWFNTIFLDPLEIRDFCRGTGFSICYDTSHAQLECNRQGISIRDFSREVLPFVRHLHVADGADVTQEGLQLGHGNLDLNHLVELIQRVESGFIAEIWKGHLHQGEGFHQALSLIQDMMNGKVATSHSCGCSSNP